jgi:hypothetical protein
MYFLPVPRFPQRCPSLLALLFCGLGRPSHDRERHGLRAQPGPGRVGIENRQETVWIRMQSRGRRGRNWSGTTKAKTESPTRQGGQMTKKKF